VRGEVWMKASTGMPATSFEPSRRASSPSVEAFAVNAVDYLLKPVEAARLAESLARAIGVRMVDLPMSPPRLSAALEAATPRMAAE
jgi:hypothetical protein